MNGTQGLAVLALALDPKPLTDRVKFRFGSLQFYMDIEKKYLVTLVRQGIFMVLYHIYNIFRK